MKSLKQLTKEEMKMVVGGVAAPLYSSCSCTGMVGSWTYTDGGATQAQAGHDIATYCRYGGTCTQVAS